MSLSNSKKLPFYRKKTKYLPTPIKMNNILTKFKSKYKKSLVSCLVISKKELSIQKNSVRSSTD